MRLGTLARKISVTPSKLTTFLESQNIDLSSGTNTKLTEEHVELILEHYQVTLESAVSEEVPATEITEEPIVEAELEEEIPPAVKAPKEEIEETEKEIEAIAEEIKEEVAPEEIAPDKEKEPSSARLSESFVEIALPHELEEVSTPHLEEEKTDVEAISEKLIEDDKEEVVEEQVEEEEYIPQIPDDLDPEIESYVERLAYDKNIKVIKPPKVKLQGLTVKGKIELPEPKVETEIIEEPKKSYDPDEIITTTGPTKDRKRKPKNYKGKKFNKDYNPLEAARKKKEWEDKKRKEQEEKRKKKAKELHYKKVAKPVATAPILKKKPKKVKAKKTRQQKQPSGNVLQRFWQWMNT